MWFRGRPTGLLVSFFKMFVCSLSLFLFFFHFLFLSSLDLYLLLPLFLSFIFLFSSSHSPFSFLSPSSYSLPSFFFYYISLSPLPRVRCGRKGRRGRGRGGRMRVACPRTRTLRMSSPVVGLILRLCGSLSAALFLGLFNVYSGMEVFIYCLYRCLFRYVWTEVLFYFV